MINKVILTGDNYGLVEKIHETLGNYNAAPNIQYDIRSTFSEKDPASNEVVFYINSSSSIKSSVLENHRSKEATYVSACPKNEISNSFDNVKHLAVQRHLLDSLGEQDITLGDLKNNIPYSEPFIRESSFFLFDLDAIRKSDLENAHFAYPSGLFSEEATQMFRYAGMNELSKVVVINNADESLLHLVSQMIWYYAEAAAIRFPDHPYFTNTVTEYIVNVDSLDLSISFYKSKTSGRWWVKIPDIPENKWKSCSYEDYQNACEDHLSPDLLSIISAVE